MLGTESPEFTTDLLGPYTRDALSREPVDRVAFRNGRRMPL